MSGYGSRPCYAELVAILAVGLGHIVLELSFSGTEATIYNVTVSLAFLGYLGWRLHKTQGVLRIWGFRGDNLWPALRAHLPFLGAGVLALAVFSLLTGAGGLPATFWLTVVLYPVWGIAQQFALQNLIANNLAGPLQTPISIAAAAALLFAASHYPRMELVVLTFVAGIFFTLAYRRHPNIWVVGTAHGLLGSMAFYVVLGEDPGGLIIHALTR